MSKTAIFVCPWAFPSNSPQARPMNLRAWQNLTALEQLGYRVIVASDPTNDSRHDIPNEQLPLEALVHCDFLPFLRQRKLRHAAAQQIRRAMPSDQTVVFCEHLHALLCSPKVPRLIYSCHDLESNLVRLRKILKNEPISLRTRAYWWFVHHVEMRYLRRTARVLCVSASEAKALERQGLATTYVPIVTGREGGGAIPAALPPVRCWFYGGSNATANKVILRHLRTVLFEHLARKLSAESFHQMGSTKTYEPSDRQWLEKTFQCHGFVKDVATEFRGGDFCLIPYEHDTGFRTKIPELCGYGVIPVGYPVSFACCPEMVDGVNCIMGQSPEDLAQRLGKAAGDESVRRSLARGGLDTIARVLNPQALIERYEKMLRFPQ